MKKLGCILMLFSSIAAHAQTSRGNFEVSAGLGWRAFSQLSYSSQPDYTDDFHTSVAPVYAISVRRYAASNCAIGITLTQHSVANDYYNYQSLYHEYHYHDMITVNFEAKVLYINKPMFQFYGCYGMGLAMLKGKDTYSPYYIAPRTVTTISMDIAPIGIKVGKKIGGFFEAGIGYKGIFNVGVVAQLGNSSTYTYGKSKSPAGNKRTRN